jgi:hypothetical protein
MAAKDYPTRALAAYYRVLARRHRVNLPVDALPSHIVEETIAERDYIIIGNGYRTLAVYRVRSDGLLRRLKRWPKALDRRA